MRVYLKYAILDFVNVTLIFSSFMQVIGAVSTTPVIIARKGPVTLCNDYRERRGRHRSHGAYDFSSSAAIAASSSASIF
jgi:hypothetical protein